MLNQRNTNPLDPAPLAGAVKEVAEVRPQNLIHRPDEPGGVWGEACHPC